MALGNLVVKMLADIKDMKNKLDGYEKKIDQAKTTTEKFAKGVQNSFKTFIKFGAIIGGAYLAIRKLTNFLKSSLDAYAAQEEAITKLNAALIATGRYTPQVSDEMQKYASEMQRLTKFSDDQITSAQAILTTFTKIGTDTFPEATEAAMNMSAMFGQDFQQSMIQLGTALNDPIQGVGRLRRIGISFTEEQKALIETLVEQNDLYGAQRVILDELQVEIGGTARAVGEEYAGKVSQLNNAFVDLKETMGFFMAEAMTPMMPKIQGMVESVNDWLSLKRELIEVYDKLAKVGKKSIDELSQAEIEASIKSLWRDKEKLELRVAQMRLATSLTTEELKQIGAYEQLIRKIKELAGKLAMEVQITDELREKYDFLAPSKKKDVKLTDEQIKAIEEYWDTLEEGKWDWIIDMYESLAESQEYLYGKTDELIESKINLINIMGMESRVIEDLNTTLNWHALRIQELKTQYDEWTQKVGETMSNITNLTSMGVNAIDNVYSQMFQNRRIELDNWYEAEKDRIYATIEDEEERETALKDLDHEADQRRRALARGEAKAGKSIAIMNAIINTASAVTKALSQGGFIFGPLMAAFIAAMGAAQIALIKAQPLPALAEGGELITSGPQLIMVGDNPGGRELVQATPLSSPNIYGPAREITLNNNLYLDSDQILSFISKASEDGILHIHERAIGNW